MSVTDELSRFGELNETPNCSNCLGGVGSASRFSGFGEVSAVIFIGVVLTWTDDADELLLQAPSTLFVSVFWTVGSFFKRDLRIINVNLFISQSKLNNLPCRGC